MQKIMGQDRLDRQMAVHHLEVEEENIVHVENNTPVINLPVMRQKFSVPEENEDTEDYSYLENDEDFNEEEDYKPAQNLSQSIFDTHEEFKALKTAVKQRKNSKETSLCTNPQCECEIPKNARFCSHCGSPQFSRSW